MRRSATAASFKLPVLRSLHWAAHVMLKKAGYRWELRRSGELKLGLWRKRWRAEDRPRKSNPRRIVLIPGFGDSPLSWLAVLGMVQPVLRRKYDELILVDFPGFGGFLAGEKSFDSMDALRKALSDVLDTLRPQAILGHSLGGWLAAHYAVECGQGARPERKPPAYAPFKGPETLILVSPSGYFEDTEIKKEWAEKFYRAVDEGLTSLRPYLFHREPSWFRYFADEFGQFMVNEDIAQFIKSVDEKHFIDEGIPDITSKVWLIWGDRDTLHPPECAPHWVQKLRSKSLEREVQAVLLKGAGHIPQIERPAVMAAILGQVLLERSPANRGFSRWWKVLKPEEAMKKT